MSESQEDKIARIREVAEMLGLSPEQLVLAAAGAGSNVQTLQPTPRRSRPAPIVYPNLEFPEYEYREYPRLLYRAVVRDVEEPFIKVIDGQQINGVRVLRDQVVYSYLEVQNKAELVGQLALGWFMTQPEAKAKAVAEREAREEEAEGLNAPPAPPSVPRTGRRRRVAA